VTEKHVIRRLHLKPTLDPRTAADKPAVGRTAHFVQSAETRMPRRSSFKVSINLPFGLGGVEQTWEPDDDERRAAWELYVELATRITTVPRQPGTGLAHEALNSLYTLFRATREILRRYGPGVAQPKGDGSASFGTLAVTVLNDALRPLLAVWHPLLQDREDQRPPEVTRVEWEESWERIDELRDAFAEVRQTVSQYARLLAEVAEVPALSGLDVV
jgi:hypothetical protein